MPATSSTAAKKAASLAFDGLLKPLIFLTNWSEAARTSSAVTGGSKLNRILIFLHIESQGIRTPKPREGVHLNETSSRKEASLRYCHGAGRRPVTVWLMPAC